MTKIEYVKGFLTDANGMRIVEISVRASVDEKSRTLSLSDDNTVMLHVPVEPIKNILRFALGE